MLTQVFEMICYKKKKRMNWLNDNEIINIYHYHNVYNTFQIKKKRFVFSDNYRFLNNYFSICKDIQVEK